MVIANRRPSSIARRNGGYGAGWPGRWAASWGRGQLPGRHTQTVRHNRHSYLTWKACHDFERTGGRAEELAIMTKVYCSEAAVDTIYDCMRVAGIASYTKDLAPLEKIMRDAMVSLWCPSSTTGATRACAVGNCTTSSAIGVITRCSQPAAKGCPKISKAAGPGTVRSSRSASGEPSENAERMPRGLATDDELSDPR
jgi:Acyl-CoA dehydrogenase, C-terminal domain